MVQTVDGGLCSRCERDADDRPAPRTVDDGPVYSGRPSADWNEGGDE